MRALFLLLLLANILFLAWTQWVAPPAATAGSPTPGSSSQKSIRLLREAPLAQELATAVQGSGLSPVAGEGVTCVSGGPYLDKAAADAAAARLERLGFTSRRRASRDDVWVGQWVRVENLATPDDAENALATLKAAGLRDAYVLTDEQPGNVISLGVFDDAGRTAEVAAIAQKAGFATVSEDRFRTADVFWLDVDRQQNAGLPGLEVFQGAAARPMRLELRPCPAPTADTTAENVNPATNSP